MTFPGPMMPVGSGWRLQGCYGNSGGAIAPYRQSASFKGQAGALMEAGTASINTAVADRQPRQTSLTAVARRKHSGNGAGQGKVGKAPSYMLGGVGERVK
ncbi:hypothetical protein DPEC_G00044980 [Dallia pectoralis]|uniref:Uncharacterized protein n=1 Tax=Dallia pectoralis TaxID=75939 RepID=A0ACC2H9J6_DALPE|nr:hypothetical protein DPEC_G00044980 [Dallia pectoralis]